MTEQTLHRLLCDNRHVRKVVRLERVECTLRDWPDTYYKVRSTGAVGLIEYKAADTVATPLGLRPGQASLLREMWRGGLRAWVLAKFEMHNVPVYALWSGVNSTVLLGRASRDVLHQAVWSHSGRLDAAATKTLAKTLSEGSV